MASFKNFVTLWSDLVGYLANNGIPVTSLVQGGRFYTFARGVVALHADGWSALQAISESFYVSTATGEMLDKRISDFGMVRFAGTTASGACLALPLSASYVTTIPADTIFVTRDRSKRYRLVEPVTISGPTNLMDLVATEVGADHNLAAGTTLYDQDGKWTGIINFTVGKELDAQSVPAGDLQGGGDIESDDSVRERFADFIKSLGKGTLLAVRTGIREHPQVNSVVLQDAVPAPGYITAWVYAKALPMSQTTRDEIQANLKGWRAGGVRVRLLDVLTVSFDVTLSLTVRRLLPGTGDQAAYNTAVKEAVELVLQDYIDGLTLGQSVYRTDLARIASSVDGVATVSVLAPTFDTLGVNLIDPADQYKTVLKPVLKPLVGGGAGGTFTDSAGPARTSLDDFPAPEELDC